MLNIELLRNTTQIPGAPGYEHKIRNFIQAELEGIVDEIYTTI